MVGKIPYVITEDRGSFFDVVKNADITQEEADNLIKRLFSYIINI